MVILKISLKIYDKQLLEGLFLAPHLPTKLI